MDFRIVLAFAIMIMMYSCSSPKSEELLDPSVIYAIDAEMHKEMHKDYRDISAMLFEYPEDYRLIDLRTEHDFEIAHLENAINIPSNEVLKEESLAVFRDTTKINLLYGDKDTPVQGIYMLLLSLGIDNNFVIQGHSELDTLFEWLPVEEPMYDYAAVFQTLKEKNLKEFLPPPPPKPKKIVLKPKPSPKVEPLEEEEEEEEGC